MSVCMYVKCMYIYMWREGVGRRWRDVGSVSLGASVYEAFSY